MRPLARIFPCNYEYEADASELLENLEETCAVYVSDKLKYSTMLVFCSLRKLQPFKYGQHTILWFKL